MSNEVRLRSIERADLPIFLLAKCGFSLEHEETVEVADNDIVELVFVPR